MVKVNYFNMQFRSTAIISSSLLVLLISCVNNPSPSNTYESKQLTPHYENIRTTSDTLVTIPKFNSKFVSDRRIEILLPAQYPKKETLYKVLYIQDGEHLFQNDTISFNKSLNFRNQIRSLQATNSISPTIVVAIWSSVNKRFNEYMPEQPKSLLNSAFAKAELKKQTGYNELYSDEYLDFLVNELRPFIIKNFQVSSNNEDSVIMGNEMGALLSLYAAIKHPDIFGNAACFEPYWNVPILGDAFVETLPKSIPSPSSSKFYFDHNSLKTDSHYKSNHSRVLKAFKQKGYSDDNLLSIEYKNFIEDSVNWKRRMDIPLKFLLK